MPKQNYVAVIGTISHEPLTMDFCPVTGDYCAVSVVLADERGEPTPGVYWGARWTGIRTDNPDKMSLVHGDATRVLADSGWHVTGSWRTVLDFLYASVEFK